MMLLDDDDSTSFPVADAKCDGANATERPRARTRGPGDPRRSHGPTDSRDGARIGHRRGVGPRSPDASEHGARSADAPAAAAAAPGSGPSYSPWQCGNCGGLVPFGTPHAVDGSCVVEARSPDDAPGASAAAGHGAGRASGLSPLGDNSPRRSSEPVYVPGYVHACEDGRWHLDLRNKKTNERLCVPYHCRSWRHRGACAKARAADDARRIREGFVRYGKAMAYLVLTFNPADHAGGVADAYRIIVRCWQVLYQRLTRRWGKAPYVLLVEEHRNRWPHVNALLGGHVGAEVAAGRWRQVRRVLNPIVEAAGFGKRLWVDARAGTAALPQYIAKYCTKAEQAPLHAPRKFRRLRATRGFLGAPKPSGEEFTGQLVTDNATAHELMEAQRERARATWGQVAASEDAGAEFYRAVDERRRELLGAIARGEADGAELGITDDPATWPEEWTEPSPRASSVGAGLDCC